MQSETQSTQPAKGSVLDAVRHTAMGPLTAGLLTGVVVGLLLSLLVPEEAGSLVLIVLGAMATAAVGFTVRYLALDAGLRVQAAAFVAAALSVHLMSVVGSVSGAGIPGAQFVGIESPGFDEALKAALATPPFSTGTLLAGVIAAIIVGWAPRSGSR